MTLITFQNGKVVMRDGKVGIDGGCCCGLCLEVSFVVASYPAEGVEDNCSEGLAVAEYWVDVMTAAGWNITLETDSDCYGFTPPEQPETGFQRACSYCFKATCCGMSDALPPDGIGTFYDGDWGVAGKEDHPETWLNVTDTFGPPPFTGEVSFRFFDPDEPMYRLAPTDPDSGDVYVPVCNPLP